MISIMMAFHARQCLFFMQDSVHEYEHEVLSHEYTLIQLLTFHIVAIKYRATSFVTGPAKINHVSTKTRRFLACLLYHNLITIYTTATKSSSLLQNLMGFLLQLAEVR